MFSQVKCYVLYTKAKTLLKYFGCLFFGPPCIEKERNFVPPGKIPLRDCVIYTQCCLQELVRVVLTCFLPILNMRCSSPGVNCFSYQPKRRSGNCAYYQPLLQTWSIRKAGRINFRKSHYLGWVRGQESQPAIKDLVNHNFRDFTADVAVEGGDWEKLAHSNKWDTAPALFQLLSFYSFFLMIFLVATPRDWEQIQRGT